MNREIFKLQLHNAKIILDKDCEIHKLKQQLGLVSSDEEDRQRVKEMEKINEQKNK